MALRIGKALNMNPHVLKNFLWGKYYYFPKEKKVLKKPKTDKHEEMFIQFAMGPLV